MTGQGGLSPQSSADANHAIGVRAPRVALHLPGAAGQACRHLEIHRGRLAPAAGRAAALLNEEPHLRSTRCRPSTVYAHAIPNRHSVGAIRRPRYRAGRSCPSSAQRCVVEIECKPIVPASWDQVVSQRGIAVRTADRSIQTDAQAPQALRGRARRGSCARSPRASAMRHTLGRGPTALATRSSRHASRAWQCCPANELRVRLESAVPPTARRSGTDGRGPARAPSGGAASRHAYGRRVIPVR